MIPSFDEIAKRYAIRPGCRFVGHEPVGIAVFSMNVRVVVTENRPLPPIDEFLLRSLNNGVSTPESLTAFLGLDTKTVERRLVELRREEFIDIASGQSEPDLTCRLTRKGQQAADLVERSEINEYTVPVILHGFLRRPLMLRQAELLRPIELRERGWREVPAIPSRNPNPDEIDLDILDRVLTRHWRQRKGLGPPKLLAVRSIAKGVRTLYLPAVMLVYEALGNPGQHQVGFAVDGLLDEEYEREFAARGGLKRIADIDQAQYKSTAQLAAEYLPAHQVAELGPLEGVDQLKENLDVAEISVEDGQSRLAATDQPDTRQELRRQVAEEESKAQGFREQLAQSQAKRLATYDCADVLRSTLKNVQERLVIVSAFISSYVVDNEFIGKLESALSRGVVVWIAYGLGGRAGGDRDRGKHRDWVEAEKALATLRKRHRTSLKVANLGDTHEKILLCDRDYVVTGSFNWLSFRGDRGRGRRREDALQVTHPDIIDEYFTEITSRFDGDDKRAP